jgi:hypothetical protein
LVESNPVVTLFASGGAVVNQPARISEVQPVKQGFATGIASGTYSAIVDHLYRVEIHVEGTGAFGSAQWRWTDDATKPHEEMVWNDSNLTTQDGVAVALNNGVFWTFNAVGVDPVAQFRFPDYWLFQVALKYGYQKGLDGSRDHEYRSGSMPTAATIEHRYDMGTAVSPDAFVMLDHNVPSNAITQVIATASNFTTVVNSTTVPWTQGKMLVLLSGVTSRYRVIRVTTTSTAPAQGYLRWSELFLGASLTMTKQFLVGFERALEPLGAINVDTLRRGSGPYMPEGEQLRVHYSKLHVSDQANLRTLRTWSNDPVSRLWRPFYVLLRDDVLTDFSLYNWTNGYVRTHSGIMDYYDVEPEWAEVVRSIA